MADKNNKQKQNWSFQETVELIKLYTSTEYQDKFCSGKKSHRITWEKLAEDVTSRPGTTGSEARYKWNNTKSRYLTLKRSLSLGQHHQIGNTGH